VWPPSQWTYNRDLGKLRACALIPLQDIPVMSQRAQCLIHAPVYRSQTQGTHWVFQRGACQFCSARKWALSPLPWNRLRENHGRARWRNPDQRADTHREMTRRFRFLPSPCRVAQRGYRRDPSSCQDTGHVKETPYLLRLGPPPVWPITSEAFKHQLPPLPGSAGPLDMNGSHMSWLSVQKAGSVLGSRGSPR
jgi:hypothetical protein